MTFEELCIMYKSEAPPEVLLAFDPGETTGWCVFNGRRLQAFGQINGIDVPDCALKIGELMAEWADCTNDLQVVYEEYRPYRDKIKIHINANLFTPQLIGAIRLQCRMMKLKEPHKHMAGTVKPFCTDDKLSEWGWYRKTAGQRHARDAIRHAAYYLLFHKTPKVVKLQGKKL